MKSFKRSGHTTLVLLFAFLFGLPLSMAEGQHLITATGSPSIIINPDYYDPYGSPSLEASPLPGHYLLSADGYMFVLHEGKRLYTMPQSYALAPAGGAAKVSYYGAPMIVFQPGAVTFSSPSIIAITDAPVYYVVSP